MTNILPTGAIDRELRAEGLRPLDPYLILADLHGIPYSRINNRLVTYDRASADRLKAIIRSRFAQPIEARGQSPAG